MKQLDPKAVWLFFFNSILAWLLLIIFSSFFFLAATGAFNDKTYDASNLMPLFSILNWLWFIVPAVIILCFVWAKLTYHFYRYELTDNGFRKESGVIYKKYVTIPYDRIQNVDIYRGILARFLGLSDLQIQTAGASAVMGRYGAMGMGAEGRLPGLSREIAERLRDELIQRARHSSTQGL